MPDLVIKQADFQRLSEATRRELLEFLKDSLFVVFDGELPVGDLTADEEKQISLRVGSELEFDRRISEARRRAVRNYQDYLSEIYALQERLDQVVSIGSPIRFQVISVEVATAVLMGLGQDSRNVLAALLKEKKISRDRMAEVVGGAQKINGTIGSINRRLANRFSRRLYGKANVDAVRLIEFDEEYKLTCDGKALELALHIVESGYDASKENLVINFNNKHEASSIRMEALAVRLALDGHAYVEDWSWDYRIEIEDLIGEDRFYSVSFARTISSATLAMNTTEGEEWEVEKHKPGKRLTGFPGNFLGPSTIKIDARPHSHFWES